MNKFNLSSFMRFFTRSKAGFSLVEVMVAILILTIGLLGVGYGLHASYKIDNDSMGLLNGRTEYKTDPTTGEKVKDSEGNYILVKVGLRDPVFNDRQLGVYKGLK